MKTVTQKAKQLWFTTCRAASRVKSKVIAGGSVALAAALLTAPHVASAAVPSDVDAVRTDADSFFTDIKTLVISVVGFGIFIAYLRKVKAR